LWDWHIPTGKVIFSHKWCASLGFEPDELEPHVDTWKSLVHPDDMPKVWATLTPHFEGKTEKYECHNRLRMKSGEYRSNLDIGQVIERDGESNEPVRMIGHDLEIAA
jgi:hypothetical protein